MKKKIAFFNFGYLKINSFVVGVTRTAKLLKTIQSKKID